MAATADVALSVLNEAAAKSNNKEAVFANRARFPAVFDKADAVGAAEAALQTLLPDLRRRLRIPSLAYVHPANQGAPCRDSSRDLSLGCSRVCEGRLVPLLQVCHPAAVCQ